VIGGALQQFDFLLPFDIWDVRSWFELLAGPGHQLQELGVAAQAIGAALALTVLAIVGLVTGLGRTVLRDYGFLLEETPKGLRRRRGLLTRTDAVMPVHRVQALKVTTRILRRRFGWHALEVVSLAHDAKSGSQVVVPFAQMSEIVPVIHVAGFELARRRHPLAPAEPVLPARPALLSALRSRSSAALQLAARARPARAKAGSWSCSSRPAFAALAACSRCAAASSRATTATRSTASGLRPAGWLAPSSTSPRGQAAVDRDRAGPDRAPARLRRPRFGVAGGTLEMGGVPLADARLIRDGVLHSIARSTSRACPADRSACRASASRSVHSGWRRNSAAT
jgi:putative membrane protein